MAEDKNTRWFLLVFVTYRLLAKVIFSLKVKILPHFCRSMSRTLRQFFASLVWIGGGEGPTLTWRSETSSVFVHRWSFITSVLFIKLQCDEIKQKMAIFVKIYVNKVSGRAWTGTDCSSFEPFQSLGIENKLWSGSSMFVMSPSVLAFTRQVLIGAFEKPVNCYWGW